MAWGDIAKEALNKALETYQGLARLSATVDMMRATLTDTRDELRKQHNNFEDRVERRLAAMEARLHALEVNHAKTQGMVNTALAEALKTVLQGNPEAREGLKNAVLEKRLGDGE